MIFTRKVLYAFLVQSMFLLFPLLTIAAESEQKDGGVVIEMGSVFGGRDPQQKVSKILGAEDIALQDTVRHPFLEPTQFYYRPEAGKPYRRKWYYILEVPLLFPFAKAVEQQRVSNFAYIMYPYWFDWDPKLFSDKPTWGLWVEGSILLYAWATMWPLFHGQNKRLIDGWERAGQLKKWNTKFCCGGEALEVPEIRLSSPGWRRAGDGLATLAGFLMSVPETAIYFTNVTEKFPGNDTTAAEDNFMHYLAPFWALTANTLDMREVLSGDVQQVISQLEFHLGPKLQKWRGRLDNRVQRVLKQREEVLHAVRSTIDWMHYEPAATVTKEWNKIMGKDALNQKALLEFMAKRFGDIYDIPAEGLLRKGFRYFGYGLGLAGTVGLWNLFYYTFNPILGHSLASAVASASTLGSGTVILKAGNMFKALYDAFDFSKDSRKTQRHQLKDFKDYRWTYRKARMLFMFHYFVQSFFFVSLPLAIESYEKDDTPSDWSLDTKSLS